MIRFGSFLLFAGGFVALVAALSLGCASSFGGDPGEADCTEANLDSDPNNCGACGRTCVIPNASASCNLGECTVGICETGFTDDDGQLDNGCEADDETVVDNSCTTTCGSTGTTDPNDDQTCVAPAEECNGLDDNCDGVCDEDRAGSCRVGMHRSFGNGHLFTTDLTAAQTAPFSIEQQNYFYLYRSRERRHRDGLSVSQGRHQTHRHHRFKLRRGWQPTADFGSLGNGPRVRRGSAASALPRANQQPLLHVERWRKRQCRKQPRLRQ